MKKKKPKIKKLQKYDFGGDVKDLGLFAADTAMAEWAPNVIKQDQYSDSKFGKDLGNIASVHEAFDSQSPISKNISSKYSGTPGDGMNDYQKSLYNKSLPFAKTGSSIGEVWTGKGLGTIGTTQGSKANVVGSNLNTVTNPYLKTNYDPTIYQQPTEDQQINNSYEKNTKIGQPYRNGGKHKLPHFSNYPVNGNYEMTSPDSMFAMGGMPCHECGGMQQYPDGGQANAEVEKQEMMQAPNGQTMQVNGASHEAGGIPVSIPTGTKILSDRLKMPGTKKTFAKLGSKYKVDAQEKVLDDPNATSTAKETAKLVADIKNKKFNELFNTQEALKQSKVKAYADKLGVTLPQLSQDNENTEPQGQSEQSEGEFANGGRVTLGYQDPRVTGGIDMTNPSSVQDATNIYTDSNGNLVEYKKGGRFMGINPAHKGYCTPMSKPTCTGHRRALALTLKKHHGFHAMGGEQLPEYADGGSYVNGIWTPDTSYSDQVDKDINNGVFNVNQPEKPKSNFNSLQFIEPAINTGLQNVGNIYDLYSTRFGKKYDKEDYGQMTPRHIDYTQSLRDADIQNNITRGAIKDAVNGNAGSYINNSIQAGAANTMNKARIRQAGDQYNVGVDNQFLPLNKELAIRSKVDTEQNKARSEDIARRAVRGISSNASSAYRDYKAGQVDQNSAKLLSSAFANYGLDINNPNHWDIYYKIKNQGGKQ